MPELGFDFAAWNGAAVEDEQASVSATIGLCAGTPNLQNRFVLQLSGLWHDDDERLSRLVETFVDDLHPDQVVWFAHSAAPAVRWSRE
jgi:hypothetical protein